MEDRVFEMAKLYEGNSHALRHAVAEFVYQQVVKISMSIDLTDGYFSSYFIDIFQEVHEVFSS